MVAYYNENDPFAAQWLRNLIAAGHIAPGDVDDRSITEVRSEDVRGYTQAHFFAGIGLWSLALRWAGWPDDRPVWTGSCPCQPFSNAGQRKGYTDDRHLAPVWLGLIAECRPASVFGEQVASKDGRAWLAALRAEMESLGYAIGATDLCAAGVGAPHIRQRLWFGAERMADTSGLERERNDELAPQGRKWESSTGRRCASGGLADADDAGPQGRIERGHGAGQRAVGTAGVAGGLADADDAGHEALQRELAEGLCGGAAGGRAQSGLECGGPDGRPRPPHIDWNDADWLFCRDGKWRPVAPGTFPLADGSSARVGQLRAYGNAIVPQVAAQFIGAFMEAQTI